MARRLSAFALATVLIGAPVGSEICLALCATHDATPIDESGVSASHQHHDSSHTQSVRDHVPADPALVSVSGLYAGRRACGEWVSIAVASRDNARAPVGIQVTTVAGVPVVFVQPLLPSDVDSRHGPPNPIRSVAPLRI